MTTQKFKDSDQNSVTGPVIFLDFNWELKHRDFHPMLHTAGVFYILIYSVIKAIAEVGFARGSLQSLVENKGICVPCHNATTL